MDSFSPDALQAAVLADPGATAAIIDAYLAHRPHRSASVLLVARSLRLAGEHKAAMTIGNALIDAHARVPAVTRAIGAFAAGRLQDAEAMVRRHLAFEQDNVAATLLLAEIAIRAGIPDEAVNLYRDALALVPDHRDTKFRLADALAMQHRPVSAITLADEVVAIDPDDVQAVLLRLTMLAQIGEYDAAMAGYTASLERLGHEPALWVGYANLLKTTGNTAESIAAYRHAISLNPESGEAWWGLADLKTGALDARDIGTMESLLKGTAPTSSLAMHLHFAIGKAWEDLAAVDKAFAQYERGNALVRANRPHDADAVSDEVTRSINLFTPAFFERRARAGCPDAAPIFILGMPRAGSTLIEQILASHRDVEGTAELSYIPLIAHRLLSRQWQDRQLAYPDVLERLDAGSLAALGRRYLETAAVHRKTDRAFFIDKLPENWTHIGLIHLILPNATIIDARRAPLACGFGNFRQYYARGRSFASSLGDIGRYYADYLRMMNHIDHALPGRVIRVDHETLAADTEGEVRRMLDRIGLPFDPACLRFYENSRPVRTASASQVRRPIDSSSGDAAHRFAHHLGDLVDALGTRIP